MRRPARLAAFALCTAVMNAAPVLNAVEFPFSQTPRELWEKELVWMKNAGIGTVALEARAAREEADLMTILRIVRQLELTAWVKLDPQAASLATGLEPMMTAHGGPVAYLNAGVPQPVTRISALAPAGLPASRNALANSRGTILWTDFEDTLRPEFHRGAISFQGEEQPSLGALLRDALLVGYWRLGLDSLTATSEVRPSAAKLPDLVTARQLLAPSGSGPSAVSVVNRSKLPFRADLRVFYPPAKRFISLPGLEVPAGESLWLPVNIPLAKGLFCKNCSAFGNGDSIVYSTVELIGAEYENGLFAMEFSAPAPGEAILHLAKEPSGPFLAAGKPRSFDWDESTGRARLAIPAGKAPGYRVRVSLVLEMPDHSAFFEDARILIIGKRNMVQTTYSSDDIAGRSRIRGPGSLKFEPVPNGPLRIDYAITVPPTALDGDRLELALEADGAQLGHATVRLLAPASLRLREAVNRHFGSSAELPIHPALLSMDRRSGRDMTIAVRNNFPEIKNFVLELSGDGLEFSPARSEISIGPSSERDVSIRVFSNGAAGGLREGLAKLSGAGDCDLPMLFAVIPRGETIDYSAGGVRVVESGRARAVFADGREQKWLEFTWKDSERNVLPETGVDFGPGARKITIKDAELTVEQDAPLPPEKLKPGKRADINLQVQRPSATKAVYTLSR